MVPSADDAPGRLGLSLAGGGFRASLFHLGVLRRLAELDVLRRVEVLSTVSGGSITGGLYVLLLKRYLEAAEPVPAPDGGEPIVRLSREEYVELVEELERILVGGVRKNLRTLLLMNPLGVLIVMLTGDSLGRRMARLYERYLLRDAVAGMEDDIAAPRWWLPRRLWPGQVRMRDLAVTPGGRPIDGGFAAYNARQRRLGGSVVTSIILNATTLNSGGRFYFSAVELGDWYLGYFRESEFDLLLARKALLALSDDELRSIVNGAAPGDTGGWRWSEGEASRSAALALRMRGADGVSDDTWSRLFAVPDVPGQLPESAFGLLRKAKLAAWYIRVGSGWTPPVLGSRTVAEHIDDMWAALKTIDPDVTAHLRAAVGEEPALLDTLADYLLELYWLRSAERMSNRIRENWNAIRVGHAIGASACFPPVFPPFLIYGLYDDLHVPRLGLTDGGVYDNLGVTALLDEDCTEIIASDTSGLFNVTPSSTSGHAGLAVRIPDLLMRALGGVQRKGLQERRRVSRRLAELAQPGDGQRTALQEELAKFNAERELNALVYFHVASPAVEPADPTQTSDVVPPLPGSGIDALDIAKLRTDLDAFGDVEVAALMNHGYDTADRYVRRYAIDLIDPALRRTPPIAPRRFTGPNAALPRAKLILEVGSARFFRALKLRAAVSWIFTIVAVAGILVLAWLRGWTIDGILAGTAGVIRREIALIDRIARLIPGIDDPASQAPAFLTGVLAVIAAGMLWSFWRRPGEAGTQGKRVSVARAFGTVRKWARALSGNILWAVLLLPAVIAIASAALATISWLFFHLPFMRAVRIPGAAQPTRRSDGPGPGKRRSSASGDAPRPYDQSESVAAGG